MTGKSHYAIHVEDFLTCIRFQFRRQFKTMAEYIAFVIERDAFMSRRANCVLILYRKITGINTTVIITIFFTREISSFFFYPFIALEQVPVQQG